MTDQTVRPSLSVPPARYDQDRLDLLDYRKKDVLTGFDELMKTQNQLLYNILSEIRRTHPDQRTVIDLQFTNPLRVLSNSEDRVQIRFINEGKRVKSLYTLISNGCTNVIGIGINEPVLTTSTQVSGYQVAVGGSLEITAEVEFLEIGMITAGGDSVGINNSGGLATDGVISVYGWTVPSEAYR